MSALRYRDVPLFVKVLVPFLGLIVLIGTFGGLLIVRDLSTRAKTRLEQSLSEHALDARSSVRDRELYLIESANFASNLFGMAEAINERDTRTIARLLQSVLALKTDLNVVVATDKSGRSLVQFRRARGEDATRSAGRNWATARAVADALRDRRGGKFAGFADVGGRPHLVISAAICGRSAGCAAAGGAVVGIDVDALAGAGLGPEPRTTGIALYSRRARLLGSAGHFEPAARPPPLQADAPFRTTRSIGSTEVATLYVPWKIQGRRAGTIAVTIPTERVLSSVRGARWRLAGMVLLAMLGVVALGALLSRFILARVRVLLDTNRALGRGELSARAPVLGDDELGELARGVNQMAEQLQASHETLELRVAQRTEEVERLLRERTEFFASLSHELRTPLAIILREAELMLDPSYKKKGRWFEATGTTVHDSAQQLLTLVNDILELARAEAGRIELRLEDVKLQEVIADLRPTITGLARAGGLKATIHVPRDMPPVRADRARLREILINLCDNAVKYTPDGGRIEVSARVRAGAAEVAIADTGVGIPAETAERIFEPFFRVRGTKTQRGQASSGLGLALTRRLVEAHGGTIAFTSAPALGSTFVFTLPLVHARDDAATKVGAEIGAGHA